MKKYLCRWGMVLWLLLPFGAHAQGFLKGDLLKATANATGIPGSTAAKPAELVPIYIGNIINTVLGALGFLVLFYLLYGGYKWMTSGESEKGTIEAKSMIKNALIGLVIIVSSVVVTSFVISRLCQALVQKGGSCS